MDNVEDIFPNPEETFLPATAENTIDNEKSENITTSTENIDINPNKNTENSESMEISNVENKEDDSQKENNENVSDANNKDTDMFLEMMNNCPDINFDDIHEGKSIHFNDPQENDEKSNMDTTNIIGETSNIAIIDNEDKSKSEQNIIDNSDPRIVSTETVDESADISLNEALGLDLNNDVNLGSFVEDSPSSSKERDICFNESADSTSPDAWFSKTPNLSENMEFIENTDSNTNKDLQDSGDVQDVQDDKSDNNQTITEDMEINNETNESMQIESREKDDETMNSEDAVDDNDLSSKDPVFVTVNEDKNDKDDSDKDDTEPTNPIEVNESMIESLSEDDNSQRKVAEFVQVDADKVDKDDEEKDDDGVLPTNPIEVTETEDDENTLFVPVESDKDDKDEDKDDEDPIPSVEFETISETQQGADEELCIIPDTERVISQAEKDAASTIAPLKDLSEAAIPVDSNEGTSTSTSDDLASKASSSENIIISKCNIEELQMCVQCVLQRKIKYKFTKDDQDKYICSDNCLDNFKSEHQDKCILNWECALRVKDLTSHKEVVTFERKCACCEKKTDNEEKNLTWQIMDFCGESCLSKYQVKIGSTCSNCSSQVRSNSLGKYCVRFGNGIRQFCTSHCLEEYKKGLKVCSYCHQDMSLAGDGFLAPVGDKGQFKDFCSKLCMEKYDIMTNNRPPKVPDGKKCSVCKTDNSINIEFDLDNSFHYFCSDRCFVAFSFVNNINTAKCSMCRRYFSNDVLQKHTMFYDNVQYSFCSDSCQNIYIIAHRKIVPCVWCKVKKYNFDMIRRCYSNGTIINMCSLNCLSLFQLSVNAVNSKKTNCNYCLKNLQPMFHLTMSDATIRNFCSYNCVIAFQNQYKKRPLDFKQKDEPYPVPTGGPKRSKRYAKNDGKTPSEVVKIPVISSVQSLAGNNSNFMPVSQCVANKPTRSKSNTNKQQHLLNSGVEPQTKIKHHIIVKPAPVPDQRNVSTMCKIRTNTKSTNTKVTTIETSSQTDQHQASKILIPVPVPIYVPVPLHMYSNPLPCAMPFPIPIPVPIFIPTTRNSAKGIMKEIKKIQVKIPTDPFEAELLMMAEMVAGDKKEENTDSESDVDDPVAADEGTFSPEPVDASNTFGDDMLQMALKMATELEEPAVDLEGALTASTITAPQGGETVTEEAVDDPAPMQHIMERQSNRGRKRGSRTMKQGSATKRRRVPSTAEIPVMPPQPVAPSEPTEKPDAHLCLKYTFGVNAWKQWVTTKNQELEKSTKFVKLFKTEILQLTSDELNYSLCLFVKEVRKPNGAEYAPDTIYYLCLGIQQYLFENARIDNIFCDPYYEQFTDSLDEVARKFSVLYNDSHYIVTRVEEEHLWESKQLGAHSPHVLLSTLMFFNTKHFNLTTVEEHMQLSFSHIMKHWKRNPNQSGVSRPGSRNVLLRFYPPQSAIQNNTRKKKVYEQQENEENPLRCPVKLYEFYLSKCPESVKTRNDVFYLQPERSCVPDSPVWYSTTPLCREALEKMLHRIKMVKEINVALLTS